MIINNGDIFDIGQSVRILKIRKIWKKYDKKS